MASDDQFVLPLDSDPAAPGSGLPTTSVAEDFLPAADRGDAKSQYLLAQMYHYGCSQHQKYVAIPTRGGTGSGFRKGCPQPKSLRPNS